jgi:general secretion pathway protein J
LCVTSSNRGFTLIEILIAVVLLGILSAALYGSYFTVLSARERASEGMEARRELGSTLDLIRREFAAAPKFDPNVKGLRFIVEDRDNFGKPASSLEMTTMVPSSGQGRKESGISAVRYRLEEKDKRFILTRREQDIFFESPDAKAYPQMEQISDFLVECSSDGSKWVRSWDTALNGALPKMLRVTVHVVEDGRPVEFYVLANSRVGGP